MSENQTFPNRREGDIFIAALRDDIRDMKDALKALADSMSRLAVVEERHSQTANGLERAFEVLKSLEARVSALELATVNNNRTSHWVDKAAIAALAALGTFAAAKLGLHP